MQSTSTPTTLVAKRERMVSLRGASAGDAKSDFAISNLSYANKKMASTSAAPELSTLAAEEAEAVARVRAQYAARRERLSARAGSAPADASAPRGCCVQQHQPPRALAQYDTNGDGHLSHREFMRAVAAAE